MLCDAAICGRNAKMEILISKGLTPYPAALTRMEERVDSVRDGHAPTLVWLLEHPACYTSGTSAAPEELLDPLRLPIYRTGRGGRWTYHGPGQRIIYLVHNLREGGKPLDLRAHVTSLMTWIESALMRVGIEAKPRAERIGLWTPQEQKIAAIGVRVRGGVAFHGAAININPDLNQFSGIVPCGLATYGITSVALELQNTSLAVDFCDAALLETRSMYFS